MAVAVTNHPDRFRGLATLPIGDPAAAAAELKRTVRDHGFVGADQWPRQRSLPGRQLLRPVFESAETLNVPIYETLNVPIYLHPTVPPQPVIDAYYSGFAPRVSAKSSIAGVGWHIDTGIHCLRLILGGVFDRFPRLQVIVGISSRH